MSNTNKEVLAKKLAKIEKELEKCRTTVLEDGWQTMRHAKKARKWDILAQEKMKLIGEIEMCDDKDGMCSNCNCWKHTRAMCS